MLKKEELAKLSTEEVYQKVCESLYFSPSEFTRNKEYTYKLNSIANLENVIYQCPKCYHEGLLSFHDHLTCPKCSYELHYDHYGFLNNQGLDELFEEQENRVREDILNDPDFMISAKTKLMSFHENKLQVVGSGTLTLKRFMYTYEGTYLGLNKTLQFKVENTPTLPSDIGRNVQIYEGDQIYQFELEIPWLPTKFVHASEYLYEIKTKHLNN